jgi:uncharacterized protein (DUF2236 family)
MSSNEKNRSMSTPIFTPSSVYWRVNRELAMGLAGPRAVLMQIAHPLIAAGVAEHSQFRKHRLGRLFRTSLAATVITFSSREFALRALRAIARKHKPVHGTLKVRTGAYPAGTPYDAEDPELKLWVISTLTDSALETYDRFVTPLSKSEREEYYFDSLAALPLFGIPMNIAPRTFAEFECYMADMLNSARIQVGDDAREIAAGLFSPSVMGMALRLGSAAGIGMLPEKIRQDFGFSWNARHERWLQRAGAWSRRVRKHVPVILCSSPAATISEWIFRPSTL